MKKTLLIITTVLGLSLNAQDKGNFEFGLGAGLNRSNIYSGNGSADVTTAFNIHGSGEYYFSDTWGIKAKVFYDRKGWDNGFITDINSGEEFITDFNLDYLTIPVMANWHFGRTKNWYLNFGPYAGFLLSAKDTRFDADVTDGFNGSDFGLALGIGVKIPVTDYIKIYIDYDGQFGFSDVFDGQGLESAATARDAFNVGINFML
jgi:hypothetical protein